jgi:hypothetical protein
VRVLYAVLCEDAAERHDGRLDVEGIFHQLYAPGFPAQQDRMTLAVAVEWAPEERGEIEFSIHLLDPGRSPAITISGHTEVSDQGPAMGPPQTRIVMPLEGVVFPGEGTYQFELEARGETRPLTPLHLIHHRDQPPEG